MLIWVFKLKYSGKVLWQKSATISFEFSGLTKYRQRLNRYIDSQCLITIIMLYMAPDTTSIQRNIFLISLQKHNDPLPFWINQDATPPSNFQPVRLLDPGCWYKFTYWMTNIADPDQLASWEANWSGSTVFEKTVYLGSAGPGLCCGYLLKAPWLPVDPFNEYP